MSNFNYNHVSIGGRLTADPELRTTTSGVTVTNITVAVNRNGKADGERVADFFRVTAWRQTAEFIVRYFRKGSSIFVTGRLETRSKMEPDGKHREWIDIVAENVSFVDSKAEAPASAPGVPQEAPHFEEIDQDDVPF